MQNSQPPSVLQSDETSIQPRKSLIEHLKNIFDKTRSSRLAVRVTEKFNIYVRPKILISAQKLLNYINEFRSSSSRTKFKMLIKPATVLILVYLFFSYGGYLKPPKLQISFPGDGGAEIPLDSTIEIQFDRNMNKASVEKAFSITPEVKGSFSWTGDSRLIYTPEKPLNLADKYTLKIGPTAVSSFFIPKIKTNTITFETLGHPKVILASPQIEAPNADSPITVMFDRAMIPLTTADEKENFAPAFTLDPEVKGEGRWLGTTAYQFRAEEPFKNATTYTYRVVAGMKSKDGGELQEDVSFSFSTPRPRVLATTPPDGYQYANPTASVSATLNLPINLDSAQTSMHLFKLKDGSEEEVPTSVRINRSQQVGMYPSKPLEREVSYEARIAADLLSTEGGNGLEDTYSWKFRTSPLPKITGTSPKNGAKEVDEQHSIQVNFVSPMDEKSFKKNVVIFPAPERDPSIYFSSYNNQQTLSIGTYLGRSTLYTITIKGAVKDQHGVPLGSDYSFSFTTAPYKPSISIVPSGTYFASFNQEIVPRIVTKVVNAGEVNYKLYKLTRDDFLNIYRLRYLSNYPQNTLQDYDASKHELVREWKETYEANQNVPVNVITKVEYENGNKIPSGFYFLDARIGEGKHDNLVMIITRSSLTLKTSPKQAFVWAVDQTNGEVIKEAEIEIMRLQGQPLSKGKTNGDGVYKADIDIRSERENYTQYDNPLFVFSKKGDDLGVVVDNWLEGIQPYDFGLKTYYDSQERDNYKSSDQIKIHIVVDRPIYRPGQTVYYKGVVRRDSDGKYSLLEGENSVNINVNDSQGREIFKESSQLNSYGTFSGEFKLSEEGSLGYYTVNANILGNGFSQQFQVEEYKRPDFAVEVTTDKPDYVDGDSVKAEVAANFYFGAPLDHTPLTWTLTTDDYPYRWNKDVSYEFGDSDSYWYEPWWEYSDPYYYGGKKLSEGKGATDKDGKFTVTLPLNISGNKTNQRMRLEAVVKEENNQVIAASYEWTVHQANLHVGIKPERYSSKAGNEAKVEVVSIGIDGQEIPNVPVKVFFYKRAWSYIKEKDSEDGEFYWVTKANDTLVTSVDVVTDEFGRVSAGFTPTDGGTYHAVAEAIDSQGRKTKSGTHLWVSGYGTSYPKLNHDRVVIVPDKQEYEIGDEVKIVASLPYDTTTGLFTVERGSVFDYKVVKTTPEEQSTTLPVKDIYAPNAFVSAIFVKGGKDIKDPPQFKMGVAEIRVNNPKNKVSISLKSNKDKYVPGEEAKVEIETKDGRGVAIQTELMVALVDEAVWSLARAKLADVYETFYRPRNLNVLTSNDLTKSMDRLNANVNLGSKGGSGGGGGDGGPETAREKFLDTAYWNSHIETNAEGKASFSVKLPDNLTTWRIVGIAVSKDTAVGDAVSNLLVTKDVLIRPHLPRFVSVGDLPKLGMTVHNNKDGSSNVEVSIKTEGIKVLEDSVKTVSIPARGSQSVFWNTEVENGDSASITLEAKELTGGFSDAVKLTLPVLTYFTPEVVATSGQAKDVGNEKIYLPDEIVPDMGQFEISLSPTLGSGVQDAARYLLTYPYWCNEQIINRVSPSVYLLQIVKETKQDSVGGYSKNELENLVTDGVQRLVNAQRPDGGWGWWLNYETDPYLSGMVLDGLLSAKKYGFAVPDSTVNRAKSYLSKELAGSRRPLEVQAYLAYVVAKTGSVEGSVLNRLMDKRWQMNELGRAYLLRAMQEGGGGKRDQARIFDELITEVHKTNTTAHWEIKRRDWSMMSGNVSLTSVILEAILQKDSKHPLIPDVTRWLIQARRDGHWETTHETGVAVRAIASMLLARGETKLDEDWQILIDGVVTKEGEFKKGDFLDQEIENFDLKDLAKNRDVPVKIQRSGTGALYYNMNLRYYLPFEEVESKDLGMVVIREFVDRQGNALKKEVLNTQDELWVRLILLTPSQVHHVVLEDRLPAGLEAVNESLATTSLLNVDKLEIPKDRSPLYFRYHEIRDEKVVLFAETLPVGVYEYTYRVRPTIPGRYHHPPAEAYNMYVPEISGHSAGGWMEIK